MNLFTYGTLMAPDIMEEVSGIVLESVEATLPGYQRFQVRDEQYPGIVVADDQKVTGILYLNVSADAMKRLDLFEGDMYRRESVTCDLGGETLPAMTYVVKEEHAHRLTSNAWDFDTFLKDGKQLFENMYNGFNEIS